MCINKTAQGPKEKKNVSNKVAKSWSNSCHLLYEAHIHTRTHIQKEPAALFSVFEKEHEAARFASSAPCGVFLPTFRAHSCLAENKKKKRRLFFFFSSLFLNSIMHSNNKKKKRGSIHDNFLFCFSSYSHFCLAKAMPTLVSSANSLLLFTSSLHLSLSPLTPMV